MAVVASANWPRARPGGALTSLGPASASASPRSSRSRISARIAGRRDGLCSSARSMARQTPFGRSGRTAASGSAPVGELLEELRERLCLVRVGPGELRVEREPGRPDVGRTGGARARRLLRRHVRERPEHALVDRLVARVLVACDAEVGEGDGAVAGDEDVRGLDVAMHDPARVCIGEGVAHRGDRAHGLLVVEAAPVEALPLDELRHEVDVVVVVLDAEHGVDVGVVELARRASLAVGPRGEALAAAEHLHRDPLAAVGARAVDGAESAPSELLLDRVAVRHQASGEGWGQGRSGGLCHGAHEIGRRPRDSCKSSIRAS